MNLYVLEFISFGSFFSFTLNFFCGIPWNCYYSNTPELFSLNCCYDVLFDNLVFNNYFCDSSFAIFLWEWCFSYLISYFSLEKIFLFDEITFESIYYIFYYLLISKKFKKYLQNYYINWKTYKFYYDYSLIYF